MELYAGILIRDTSVRVWLTASDAGRIIKRLYRFRPETAGSTVRVTTKGVHILRGLQSADKHAFDHVSARMAGDNRVAVDLDLSPLISGRGISRQHVVHRYRDIMVLERRFGFPITLSSHARSVLDMRSVREIAGLVPLSAWTRQVLKRHFSE